MRILVTGAGGMLGRDMVSTLSVKHDLRGFTHAELDITDKQRLGEVLSSERPDLVINCAAYTKVDLAEDEPERAYRVNAIAVHNLASICERLSIKLCHISTDYVFSGRQDVPYQPFDQTGPINIYGRSKLAGEEFIRWRMREFYIVRTSWLYGEGGRNFVGTMSRLLREKDEIKVVTDQRGSPTWTRSLSEGVERLIETDAYGIHHLTDRTDGGISWYDFVVGISEILGINKRIVPIPSSEYPTKAVRPAYSVLDTFFTEMLTGYTPPFWKDSLRLFLKGNN